MCVDIDGNVCGYGIGVQIWGCVDMSACLYV